MLLLILFAKICQLPVVGIVYMGFLLTFRTNNGFIIYDFNFLTLAYNLMSYNKLKKI
jgi:hypothetical protein